MERMSRTTVLPVLAAIGALVVAGWFYVGTRQTSDLAAAGKIANAAGDHLSAADARRVRSLLDSAAFLNPNRQVALDRSRVALKRGDRALAYRLASSVTRAEPMNALAWEYAFQSAPNPAARNEAVRRVDRLVPRQ
jgi:hypothetical protein